MRQASQPTLPIPWPPSRARISAFLADEDRASRASQDSMVTSSL
jgi:hypothetical protein